MNIEGRHYAILIAGVIAGGLLYLFVQPIIVAPIQKAITG